MGFWNISGIYGLAILVVLGLISEKVAVALISPTRFTSALKPHYPPDEQSQQCKCNLTEIFTKLPNLIQAIGMDDRTKFAFKGERGERGQDGPHGPQGLQGFPGRKGNRGESGRDGLPGPSTVGEKGEQGTPGNVGRIGRKGQKGEPAPHVYQRRLMDQTVVEIKGEKGAEGRRGQKGDTGEPGRNGVNGTPGISLQGEKGAKGEPSELPELSQLRGPPGPRGPPGFPGRRNCKTCNSFNKLTKEEIGPIYIPMQGEPGPPGPPGLSVVGQKGETGSPGPAATTVAGSLPMDVASEDNLKISLSQPVGTLAFVRSDETLFIFTRRGWREVELGRYLSAIDDRRYPYDPRSQPKEWSHSN